ncbi:hypothetical protein Q4567_06445 [Aliiglaciecola sp. 2_MG-2023]|uniref:hypothetical protein n=1 Tax=unclassified Aliiglaciecola TaxID=2593648 RepID=UPI0026E31FF5|nr:MULTISPECIES: hypothetical protein [unclassified Aliiglaciecola]MDO6710350.1 hypothetical protein [Aliiglaciecola sp. 2_MG-2023]MDO6751497.1 hypothetical protein [Aliiglaciecola sp. 1_MG-2023]
MKYYSNQLPISAFKKYSCIKGVYRILDAVHYDLLEGFFYELTFTDGQSKIKMCTACECIERLDFSVGAFVFIEAVRRANGSWKIRECRLVTSEVALKSLGFIFDSNRYISARIQCTNELLNEVNSKQLGELISVAQGRLMMRVEQGILFDTWLKFSINRFLSNIVCIDFSSQTERDYAIIFGLVYSLFINCVGPSKRFDMREKQDVTFLELGQEVESFLDRHIPELSPVFKEVIFNTDPLVSVMGDLNELEYIKAIQVVAGQEVQCFGRKLLDNLEAA